MSPLTTLIVIGLVGWVWAAPILPLPYQLVYLSPDPYGYHIAAPPEPVLTNRVSDEPVESPEEDDSDSKSYEVTQFHTEDQAGRIVYGFHSPDQVRMESRDPDGTVRGSYSYVDPYGNVVRMQYWDEGNGIHMAGNSLPVAVHQEAQYTPEVRAAREEHFRLYEAALATLRAAGLDDSPDHESERYPSGDYEEDPNPQSSEEVAEEEAPPSDDTVIVENASIDREPIPEYQKVPINQPQLRPIEHNVSPDNDDEDSEDDESVAIENPELLRTTWDRRGKSQDPSRAGSKPMSMEASATDHVEARALKPEEPQEDKTSSKKESGDSSKPTDKKEDKKVLPVKQEEQQESNKEQQESKSVNKDKEEVTEVPIEQDLQHADRRMAVGKDQEVQQTERRMTEEKVSEVQQAERRMAEEGVPEVQQAERRMAEEKVSNVQQAERRSLTEEKVEEVPEARAFFYHFAHQVPQQIPQPVERVEEDVTSQLEQLKQSYDANIAAATAQLAAVSQQSAAVPHESVSSRATGLGAIPIAAVHDSQVSPFQRQIIPNFHLRPVYVPPLN
uniref:Cuticle protein 6 n=1 Tax=Lygus hesperus TaxID=30085 RepID=A0A146LU40_LYGHE